MNIKIPRWLAAGWDRFHSWGYKPLYQINRFKIRRIDFAIAGAFVFCVIYYWLAGGWLQALTGGLAFILVAMIALWL